MIIEDRDFISLTLDLVRIVTDVVEEENVKAADNRDKDLFLYIIAATFYKVGIESFTMEENQIEGMVKAELELEEEARSVKTLIAL